jgi:hypothetical protein
MAMKNIDYLWGTSPVAASLMQAWSICLSSAYLSVDECVVMTCGPEAHVLRPPMSHASAP